MPKPSIESQRQHLTRSLNLRKSRTLWESWVAATAIAELVGLVIILIASTAMNRLGTVEIVVVLYLVGLLQGMVLGLAQWLVLRHYIKHVGQWIAITTIAAAIAWLISIKAIAMISFSLVLDHAGTVEGRTLELAKGVFLVGAWVGGVLGLAQWLVLKEHIRRAGWWVVVNALAWACGLLLAFWVTTLISFDRFNLSTALAAAATGLTAGAVVGGITGIALLWLLKSRLSRRGTGL